MFGKKKNTTKYETEGARGMRTPTPDGATTNRGVVSAIPKWLRWLLIPLFILAAVILGLTAFVAKKTTGTGGSVGFTIFAAVWTIILVIILFLLLGPLARMHKKIIVFVFLCLTALWWLTSWAWLTANIRDFRQGIRNLDDKFAKNGSTYTPYQTSQVHGVQGMLWTVWRRMIAAAVLAALAWLLTVLFLIIYALAAFRAHKKEKKMGETIANDRHHDRHHTTGTTTAPNTYNSTNQHVYTHEPGTTTAGTGGLLGHHNQPTTTTTTSTGGVLGHHNHNQPNTTTNTVGSGGLLSHGRIQPGTNGAYDSQTGTYGNQPVTTGTHGHHHTGTTAAYDGNPTSNTYNRDGVVGNQDYDRYTSAPTTGRYNRDGSHMA